VIGGKMLERINKLSDLGIEKGTPEEQIVLLYNSLILMTEQVDKMSEVFERFTIQTQELALENETNVEELNKLVKDLAGELEAITNKEEE
jgi:hypothetical protein